MNVERITVQLTGRRSPAVGVVAGEETLWLTKRQAVVLASTVMGIYGIRDGGELSALVSDVDSGGDTDPPDAPGLFQ